MEKLCFQCQILLFTNSIDVELSTSSQLIGFIKKSSAANIFSKPILKKFSSIVLFYLIPIGRSTIWSYL